MTTERKVFKCSSILLLLFNIVLSEKTVIIYNDNSSVNGTRIKSSKISGVHVPACRNNQYFDQQEGRCVGVAGGGKAVYINYGESCGSYILKPHCSNSKYYYICKKDKTILAECAKGQEFDSRFQKCAISNAKNLNASSIQPNLGHLEDIYAMSCVKRGRFPIPNHCDLFYICETNGHRLYQNVYRCPKNEKYDAEKETCIFDTTGLCSLNATLSCIPSIIKNSSHDDRTDELEETETNISKRTTEHLEYNETEFQSSTVEQQKLTELDAEEDLTNSTEVDTTTLSSVTQSNMSTKDLEDENITSQTEIFKAETTNSFASEESVLSTEATTYSNNLTSDDFSDTMSTTHGDVKTETFAPQAESDTTETQETFNSSSKLNEKTVINYNYTENDYITEESNVTESDAVTRKETQFFSTTVSDSNIIDNTSTTELFTSEPTTDDKEQDVYTELATTQSTMTSETELSTQSSIVQNATESLPSSFIPLVYSRNETKMASAVSIEETSKTEINSTNIVTEFQPEKKLEQYSSDAKDDIVPMGKQLLSEAASAETELPMALVLTEITEKLTRRIRDIIQLILKNLFYH